MPAILPSFKIDRPADSAFLLYQDMWIEDESRMMLAEKSVREGWTYADAFRNVRKRLRHNKRPYLFQTKDEKSSLEYMKTCKTFADIYNMTRCIVSHGEDYMKVEAKDSAGKAFTQEVKFGYMKFDNGSEIHAFSANPFAMAVFEGDVGLDEFAKHSNASLLWETAQGRITWGFDIGVWSAHNGTDTLFNQFAIEAQNGKGGWSHYKVTLEDAVEMGLVEKINETRGTAYTREGFLADARNRARTEETYQQAYMCNPQGSSSAMVTWSTLTACQRDIQIDRFHMEDEQVKKTFGEFQDSTKKARRQQTRAFLQNIFSRSLAIPGRYRLGFDVAASGQGDLCSFYLDRREGPVLHHAALLTLRTDDWDFITSCLYFFMESYPDVRGAGDETGLGRQVCWKAAKKFRNAFEGVNFKGNKHDMGFHLMGQIQSQEKLFSDHPDHADIVQDFFALRKTFAAGRWVFSESKNSLNSVSHCDIAWSGALASHADQNSGSSFRISTLE